MANSRPDSTLCHVVAVFRHGERAPIIFSPCDPNKDYWPNGAGNLTNVGKEDGYLIGKFLRERYGTFISEKYIVDELYVRSTDVDRNLMTAQCCLAGLYPPKGDDVWMTGMTWQPIPVHTMPFTNDPLIPQLCTDINIPPGGFQKTADIAALQTISESKHALQTIADDGKVKNHIGIIAILLDTYLIELKEKLPGYLPPGLEITMTAVTDLADSIYRLTCKTGSCVSTAVQLLQEICMQQNKIITGAIQKQKAFFYTMHDLTISACLEAFDYTSRTHYGGILLLEMHKSPSTNEYYMKILFKSGIRDKGDVEIVPIFGSLMVPMAMYLKAIQRFLKRHIKV